MSPRRSSLVGMIFIAIAIFYLGLTQLVDPAMLIDDFAGFTLLLALGVAMSIMAYVLISGARRG